MVRQQDTEDLTRDFYRWGVIGNERREDFLHSLEVEAGIPPELSARWDATMRRHFG